MLEKSSKVTKKLLIPIFSDRCPLRQKDDSKSSHSDWAPL